MTRGHGYIPLHSVASDTAPALSLQRVPSSSSTVQGGPSSTTPVLLSSVDSFDTAPPPCYPACLAPLCLLSGVDFFDTAPPPQDLLAGLLYTAPPPSTARSLSRVNRRTDNLATDLRGICPKVSLVADSGGIRDIDDARADFAGVCHRADSTADLGELCRSSYDLPDSTIPALPSYHIGLPSLCAA
ncbi:uncharacterized protein UDID_18062 [Ustilago sp. UG-2017a]|nr:uncharacterized protein UDID_18062 [Ustilago sp. UG-2017a]